MKLKYTAIVSLLLVIVFISAQSFYYRLNKKQAAVLPKAWFKGPAGHVAMCGAVFNPADSDLDIPALKGWGNYKWKINTAKDSAQYYFNQGISLYYAFHTIESIASFTKATKIDPSCAMAWYGKSLAMGPTINYPNGYAPPKGAYEASVKSRQLMADCSPAEQALIAAMQQRYSADTTISVKQLRMNYAAAMEKVYNKYPNNADVVTLYADALLLLHPWDLYTHSFTPKPWTPKIRTLLEQALALSPKHPGANHYYIHTMEASATPQLALKSAHVLDTLMPLVSHLTHMPSHIYIRTGYYQQGIRNNDASIIGYKNYLKQYSPTANGAGLYQLHNMHLGVNCAQMGGNYKMAIRGADSLVAAIPVDYLSLPGSDGNYAQYVYMQPIFTNVRFGKWDDILKAKLIDAKYPYANLLMHFGRGLAWCAKGNIENAKMELAALDDKLKDPALKAPIDNFSSAYEAASVARLILQGMLALAEKNGAFAVAALQKAVKAEDNLIYNEPRDWPIPARQYLARILLKTGRYNEAVTVLKKDLIINPNNGWGLTGLQTAYQKLGNISQLAEVNHQLALAWKIKDVIITAPVFD